MEIRNQIAGIQVGDKHPVRIMGVVNLSPESFYKGSVLQNPRVIVEKAKEMVKHGCDLIDVGGRSTAPGVEPISIETEKDRVVPVIKALMDEITIPISIDTQYSVVAEEALKLGCHLINDVSGLKTDPKLAEIATEFESPIILMATRKVPGDCLTMTQIIVALKESIGIATSNGVVSEKIIVDPGVGRWIPSKIPKYDLQMINKLQLLRELKKAILVGISRKSFIGALLQKSDPADRLLGSLAATAIAVYNGAHIVRTHDVEETLDVVRVAEALQRNIYED